MSTAPVLPDKPKRRGLAIGIAIAVVAVLAIIAAIVIPRLTAASSEKTVVKLGTTDASQGHWPVLQKLLAEQNIDLQIVPFTDYKTPNPALADGSIDLNAFQHIDYLSNHNVATGDDLRVVGATLIVPLPLYSTKYTDVASIPDGSRIAIPNDATNQARALRVLEAAKLITLADVTVPTPADVTGGTVTVEPVEANQTASALNDPQIAGAIVNNNFATDAGLIGKQIFEVDPSKLTEGDRPYVNIIASRPGEEDNPVFQKVWELYHDPSVTKIIEQESSNTAKVLDVSTNDVRQWLKDAEAAKKAKP